MEKAKGKKKWYTSKTKIGTLLIGSAAIMGTIGSYLKGDVVLANALQRLTIEVGTVCGILGIRDMPFINKK